MEQRPVSFGVRVSTSFARIRMHQIHKSEFKSVSLIEVDENAEDRRLDNFLISILQGVPHSHIYNLIRTGQVRVNSGRAKAGRRLRSGDRVRVPPVAVLSREFTGKVGSVLKEAMQSVIFEDSGLLVLDKPAGVTVHSGTRHHLGLIEALKLERKDEPGIELAHRLDKDTSGVLVLAKNKRVLRNLQAQWRREVSAPSLKKRYQALLKGRWRHPSEICVESSPADSESRSKDQQAPAAAVSYFSPLRSYRDCVLVDIELHTGKTHQARRHACQIRQPIAGDKRFGDRDFNRQMQELGLKRMFLHASRTTIIHPETAQPVTFTSKLPSALTEVIEKLDKREESINEC